MLRMLAVAILAAGKGTRMKSDLPKVLQTLSGVPLIERVLNNLQNLSPDRRIILVGHKADEVKRQLNENVDLEFVLQEPQNGTGHALQQLLPVLDGFDGELLVLNGDVPLLRPKTIEDLVNDHRSSNADVTLISAHLENPKGYGRVFTDSNRNVTKVVEHIDCNKEESVNKLTNAGIYCFNWRNLSNILPKLKSENKQGELYLTDTVSMLAKARHMEVDDPDEVNGINNRKQLAHCEELLQKRLRNYWMIEGVTFIDPTSCTLSENCNFGRDIIIEPQTHIRGNCKIGDKCHLGPGSFIENAKLGTGVKILYSVVRDTCIGNNASIGPFTHLRPDTEIGNSCRIGNFVEVKKSKLGSTSKVNHLSYIGDAELGNNVNIGAGTITANYDGEKKHHTAIGENSKTGANSVLVAPISIGKEVTIGAGSTITKDVPDGALAIGRANQMTKEGWKDRLT